MPAWPRDTRRAPAGLPFGVLRGYVGTDLAAHTASIKPVDLPVHGRDARPRYRRSIPTSRHPRPAGRPRAATCSSGVSSACRRRRCSPRAVDRDRRRDRRRARTSCRARSCCRPGSCPRCATCRAAPIPASRWASPSRDNNFYRAWDDDLAWTATRSRPGSTSTCCGTADFAEYCRSAGIEQWSHSCPSSAAPTT